MTSAREQHLVISSESYYEQNCTVTTKGDILDSEFKGVHWTTTLKRWWYNLFLLAHNDERCGEYYTSSFALKMASARHFRRHRGRIHPLSKFSKYWGYTVLVTSILHRLCMHHTTTVMYPSMPVPSQYIGPVLEFILLFDIWINFKSGYIDREDKKVVLDKKMGRMHYCSTKFFIHVLSSLPFQTLLLVRYRWDNDCKMCKSNRTVSWIKLLSVFGYYRVIESTQVWARERHSYVKTHALRILRIVTLAALARLQLLSIIDAINILIMIKDSEVDHNSYLALVLSAQLLLPPSLFLILELALLLRPFFIIHLRRESSYRILDQLLTMASLVICAIFFTWSIVECYRLIQRIQYTEDDLARQKDMMMNILRSRQISVSMGVKVAEYYNFKVSKIYIINVSNALINSLPRSLTDEINLTINERYIKRIPYFSEWSSDIVGFITLLAHDDFFMEGDIVINFNSPGEGLVVVKAGALAVYSLDSGETGHLIDGDYFGEMSLVTDNEVSASEVVAITHCQVLVLKKDVFRKLMRNYPDLFIAMRAQLNGKQANKAAVQVRDASVSTTASSHVL